MLNNKITLRYFPPIGLRDIAFSGDLNAYPNNQSVKQNLPDGDLNTMQRQYKVENAYPSPLKQNLQLKPL